MKTAIDVLREIAGGARGPRKLASEYLRQLEWQELLRHTLGANKERQRHQHGSRNYFLAGVGTADYVQLCDMEAAGLMRRGRYVKESIGQYFHATALGCEYIGLSKAATRRAFGDR